MSALPIPQKVLEAAFLRANWMEMRALPDGTNALIWTPRGEQRRFLLRLVIEEFKLGEEVDAPMRFIRKFVKPSIQGGGGVGEAARQFWIACLEELDLAWETDFLWTFVKFIEAEDRSAIRGMAFSV